MAAARPTKNEERGTKDSRFAAPNFNLNSQLKLPRSGTLKNEDIFLKAIVL